ncbi:RluA family pseudouridine synthase [Nocardia donostiensis]|uniref:RNA pseudouridylate synthase n=1 Tax=Nocardia donostiensis TaxID=1538463 RepID=A0A1W0B4J1_9NOCA|nr:RNA pseudouridine synthase [Nocardia donostiensis]ONM50427.1 RNA pseudouridine synthase [Nocardia donostiensis]OQS17338.1 RNA pseudouridine synthase [Nocardia donostiensis]OQS18722.1 RNA pseudouridine synthase [Nocardia donostiensis]
MDIDWPDLRDRCRILEDDAVLALNKPAGIAVTGERHDTDIVQAAEAAGETLYPVHRIDKVTSGLVLLAKELAAHGPLTRQFNKQTARKTYLAVVATGAEPLPDAGVIELPLSVGRKNRVRIAAPRERIQHEAGRWFVAPGDVLDTKNYPSTTRFATLARHGDHTVLALRPVTGRRHQIRVHLAWIGHAIIGDPLFDKSGTHQRAHLHSWRLTLAADWRAGAQLDLEAPPDPAFWRPLPSELLDASAMLQRAASLLDTTSVRGEGR